MSIEPTAISTAKKLDSRNPHLQSICPMTQAMIKVSKAPRRNLLLHRVSLDEASAQRIHEHLTCMVNAENKIFGRYEPDPHKRLVLSHVPAFDTTHCEFGLQSSGLRKQMGIVLCKMWVVVGALECACYGKSARFGITVANKIAPGVSSIE